MEYFLYYLLKSSCILFLFYGCYWLFLRKETFFISIRLFFSIGIVLSIILPWVSFTETIILSSVPENVTLVSEAIAVGTKKATHIPWTVLFIALYIFGVLFFGVRLLFQFLTLFKLKTLSYIILEAPFRHIQTPKPIAPFSFFNAIF